jgi:uncharacterized protein (TIGR00297 family)
MGAVYLLLVVAFALAALILRAIDRKGFLASVAVGAALVFGGGLPWLMTVAVFFIMGVGFTWYKYGYKKKLGSAQEKGGARSWPNILANGGLAAAFAVCQFFSPNRAFAVMFLGSISAAAADTAATELGLLSRGSPRLITRPLRRVPPGTSGGVSTLGFVGALLASLVIGAMALVLGVAGYGAGAVAFCVAGGMSGAVVDSLLGASVQRKGFCRVCLRQTESLRHCGEETEVTGGVSFVENNVVNAVATCAGAATALAFLFAFAF